ncbi:hypothetical protein [Thioalkalivibrio thiocyanodenitrificans]|uniref:hypothetical protein n=1 Tax=Thioalkalivibrio thiocyanodenitrificans TaxID=243063 RepID=UPI00035F46A9|nr:hypothetical protein [Thioalkalivibrio thiocyanodenitrificans]
MICKTIVGLFAAITLAGCGVTMPVKGNNNTEALADKTGIEVSAAAAGLQDPTTVWVPARYRQGGDNALYIDGVRFTASGGYADVGGFLPNEQGYLVAVYQDTVDHTSPLRGRFLVYYQVSPSGAITRTYGVVQDPADVVVGHNGIFAAKRSEGANPFGMWLYDYTGYSPEGRAVSGPRGVRVAAPAPDGGWYSLRPTEWDDPSVVLEVIRDYANGRTQYMQNVRMDTREQHWFPSADAVFVNEAPLSHSARTGLMLWGWLEFSHMTVDFRNYRLRVFDAEATSDRPNRSNYGFGLGNLGTASNMNIAMAMLVSERVAMFGSPSEPLIGKQKPTSGFGGLTWDLFEVRRDNYWANSTPVFTLMGAGLNTLRALVGDNTSDVSKDAENDVYAVITSEANVVILANPGSLQDQGRKAHVVGIGNMRAADAEQFVRTYGLNR